MSDKGKASPLTLSYFHLDEKKPIDDYYCSIELQKDLTEVKYKHDKGESWTKGHVSSLVYQDKQIYSDLLSFFPLCDAKQIVADVKKRYEWISIGPNKVEKYATSNNIQKQETLDHSKLIPDGSLVYMVQDDSGHFVWCDKKKIVEAMDFPIDKFTELLNRIFNGFFDLPMEFKTVYKAEYPNNKVSVEICELVDEVVLARQGSGTTLHGYDKMAALLLNMKKQGEYPQVSVVAAVKQMFKAIKVNSSSIKPISKIELHKDKKSQFEQSSSNKLSFKSLTDLLISLSDPSSNNSTYTGIDTGVATKTPDREDKAPVMDEQVDAEKGEKEHTVAATVFAPKGARYLFGFKVVYEGSTSKIKARFDDCGGKHVLEPELEKLIKPCESAMPLFRIIQEHFSIEYDKILENILPYVAIQTNKIDIQRVGDSWDLKITGQTKNDIQKEMIKLIAKEDEIKKKQEEVNLRETKQNRLSDIISSIKQTCGIDDTEGLVPKLKRDCEALKILQYDKISLNDLLSVLDSDVRGAKEKIQIIERCLPIDSTLHSITIEDLETRIKDIVESYSKLGNISKDLDTFKKKNDSTLLMLFPAIKAETEAKKELFTQSIRDINAGLVISESIKKVLADSQLRQHMDLDFSSLNTELKPYGLAIDLPQKGEQADPSRQKFVGYDSGGIRGLISSVHSWGIIELDNNVFKRSIYKPEVKIYQ